MANTRAKFFRDGEYDRVEISIIGDPNTFITKVRPEDIAQFPREWEAYKAGEKEIDYGGTPLTEVPGITPQAATALKLKGIHNAEMLAALNDAAAIGLGMGGITMRNTAQLLLKANGTPVNTDTFESKATEGMKRRGRPPKAKEPDPEPEAKPDFEISEADLMPVEE